MNTELLSKQIINTTDKKLGEGTQGQVFKGKEKGTNKDVAIKKIKMESKDEGIPSTAIREISILKHLNFPNILTINEYYLTKNELYMIFDQEESDLKRYLLKHAPLPLLHIKKIVYQTLLALVQCHKRRIVHRDLKPQNVLINHETQDIKICDFGLARSFELPLKTLTHEVVTLWQRSPEILMGKKRQDLSVDIWSTGCIMVEMANRKPLFQGDSEIDQIFKIFRGKGTPDSTTWPGIEHFPDYKKSFPKWQANPNLYDNVLPLLGQDGVDLLKAMWEQVPENRISAIEALKHPFFKELNCENYSEQLNIIKNI